MTRCASCGSARAGWPMPPSGEPKIIRGGVSSRRWLGLVLAALVTVLATLVGAGMASAATATAAETRGGFSTAGAQDVDGRDDGLTTSRSVLAIGVAAKDEFVAAPSVAPEYVYDGAATNYRTSVQSVDVRTVARVEPVGRDTTAAHLRSQPDAASEWSVSVSGFVVAAKAGAAAAEAGDQAALDYATSSSKLDHVFAAKHNFDPLVKQFGSREAVVQQLLKGLKGLTPASGTFEQQIVVGGEKVIVRGAVVDGVTKIGTAFTP